MAHSMFILFFLIQWINKLLQLLLNRSYFDCKRWITEWIYVYYITWFIEDSLNSSASWTRLPVSRCAFFSSSSLNSSSTALISLSRRRASRLITCCRNALPVTLMTCCMRQKSTTSLQETCVGEIKVYKSNWDSFDPLQLTSHSAPCCVYK